MFTILVHTAIISINRYSQVELILIRLQELYLGRSIFAVNTLGNVHIYGKVDQRAMADIKASTLHLALFLAVGTGYYRLAAIVRIHGLGQAV